MAKVVTRSTADRHVTCCSCKARAVALLAVEHNGETVKGGSSVCAKHMRLNADRLWAEYKAGV